MRAIIVFLLSCSSVLSTDAGIQVVSTVTTNTATGGIYAMDVFTRDGRTNLVRRTRTTMAGVVQIRIHRFFHAGSLIGDFVAMPDSSGFTTEAGTPYSVSFESDVARNPKAVVIGTKEGVIVDAFNYTNGVFSPVESSVITKANSVGSAVRTVIEDLSEKSKKK